MNEPRSAARVGHVSLAATNVPVSSKPSHATRAHPRCWQHQRRYAHALPRSDEASRTPGSLDDTAVHTFRIHVIRLIQEPEPFPLIQRRAHVF